MGEYVPAAVMAEMECKIDDGLPGSGRFQLSTFAGHAAGGGTANGFCTQ